MPANSFLAPPEVDDYIFDIMSDQRFLKFLKMNNSALQFVQKRLRQCMGPLSKILKEVDALDKNKSSMNVEELKELIEKFILMTVQINVARLF